MSETKKLPELFGSLVFNEEHHEGASLLGVLQRLEEVRDGGHVPGHLHRQRDRRGHEAVGRGKRRHPLHPLVPAHDRRHRGEARQLHRPCRAAARS